MGAIRSCRRRGWNDSGTIVKFVARTRGAASEKPITPLLFPIPLLYSH